jgi:hypothetical protein
VPAGSLVPRSTRAVAQFGSAPDWGSGGRGFKSRPPDNNKRAGQRVATLGPVAERALLVTHLSPRPLVVAQVRQALDQLREKGWDVGSPADPESWRRHVRSAALHEGLRVRTGTAMALSGDVCPWVIATAYLEPLGALMGGIELDSAGAALVVTQA